MPNPFSALPLLLLLILGLLTGCPGEKKTKKKGFDPSANNAVSAGNRAKLRTIMMSIKKAAQQFNAENGRWPEDMDDLVQSKVWQETKQRADPWGNDYVIIGEGPDVKVGTYGADGQPGGEGPDTDYFTD